MYTVIIILTVLNLTGLCVLLAVVLGGRKSVRAKEFLLEGEKGKIYAKLGVSEQRPGFVLFDSRGCQRAIITVTEKGPSLALLGQNGKIVNAGFIVDENGTHLKLCDKDGNPRIELGVPEIGKSGEKSSLCLYDREGGQRAILSESKNGASIWLKDAEGKNIGHLP